MVEIMLPIYMDNINKHAVSDFIHNDMGNKNSKPQHEYKKKRTSFHRFDKSRAIFENICQFTRVSKNYSLVVIREPFYIFVGVL